MSTYNQPTKEMVANYLERQGYPDLEYLDDFLNPMENKEQYWQAVYEDIDMCDFDRWQHFQKVINCKLSWEGYRHVDDALYHEDIEVLEMPIKENKNARETEKMNDMKDFDKTMKSYDEVCVLYQNEMAKVTVEYSSSAWFNTIICVYDSDGRMASHWNVVSHETVMRILEEIHKYTVEDVENETYKNEIDGFINLVSDCFDMAVYTNPTLNNILDIRAEYGEENMYRIGNSILVW